MFTYKTAKVNNVENKYKQHKKLLFFIYLEIIFQYFMAL